MTPILTVSLWACAAPAAKLIAAAANQVRANFMNGLLKAMLVKLLLCRVWPGGHAEALKALH
jgi:hypothetical protein